MAPTRKILLAVDVDHGLGSSLEWAEALARGRGASLVIAATRNWWRPRGSGSSVVNASGSPAGDASRRTWCWFVARPSSSNVASTTSTGSASGPSAWRAKHPTRLLS